MISPRNGMRADPARDESYLIEVDRKSWRDGDAEYDAILSRWFGDAQPSSVRHHRMVRWGRLKAWLDGPVAWRWLWLPLLSLAATVAATMAAVSVPVWGD